MKFSRFLFLSSILTSLCTCSSVYGTQLSQKEIEEQKEQQNKTKSSISSSSAIPSSMLTYEDIDALQDVDINVLLARVQDLTPAEEIDLVSAVACKYLQTSADKAPPFVLKILPYIRFQDLYDPDESWFKALTGVHSLGKLVFEAASFDDGTARSLSQNWPKSVKEIIIGEETKLTSVGASAIFGGLQGSNVESVEFRNSSVLDDNSIGALPQLNQTKVQKLCVRYLPRVEYHRNQNKQWSLNKDLFDSYKTQVAGLKEKMEKIEKSLNNNS